jgi:hypothetical protein
MLKTSIEDMILYLTCWFKKPVVIFSLSILWIVAFYAGFIGFILLFVPLVILIIMQIANLIRSLDNIAFIKNFNRHLVVTCIFIAVPVLLMLNMKTIDYAGTYLVVRMVEPSLLRKVAMGSIKHSDSNASFKYFRVDFGQVAANKRWIVYDESDQVSLNYQMRSTGWWRASQETVEGESCFANGLKLYSHFYIQYSDCY